MKNGWVFASIFFVMNLPTVTFAQMPPDIAAAIRKMGPIVDPVNTANLYVPLFRNQKEPYPNVTVTRDIAYGQDAANKLDVFTSGRAQPGKIVVIFVHGGGYERGDKRQDDIFYDNIMLWATQQGMVGVNFNYRLAPKFKWPAAHEDLASAMRWLKANVAQFGGDPERIVMWGQSAGASLIAGYLAHPQFHGPGGHGAMAAILNSGVPYEIGNRISAYFGGDPKELAERSSVEGMKKLNIPLLISHTEVDIPTAPVQSELLRKALCDAGRCPTYLVLKDHSHMSQNYSVGTGDVSLSQPVLQFIRGIK